MSLKEQQKLIKRGKTLLNRNMPLPKVAKELEISLQRAYDLLYLDKEVAANKLAEAKRERENFMRYRDKKVWQLRAKGMIQEDIAELLGIGASMVRAILDSDKVRADKLTDSIIKREQQTRKENKKKARALRDKKWTYEQIATEINKSTSWVMMTLGVTKRQQRWPIEKKRETVKEYKRLLSEGNTSFDAKEIMGVSRSYLHQIRKQIEEEERIVFKGTRHQWDKIRQKERIQFTEARKRKVRKEKEAEAEEKKKTRGDLPLALGYTRVSKKEQALLGGSLKYQAEEVKQYAEKKGYKLVEILTDKGMSGDDYNRPQLQELIRRAEEEEFDCVIVWMLDRLMRENYEQQKIMKEYFDPCNVDVISATQEMDRSTPQGKLMFTILGATSQYELDLIKFRAKRSSQYEWSKGEWKAPAAIPLGFKMKENGKHLEFHDENINRLKKIYRLIYENKGRVPTHPDFMNYEQIAIECGVGKGKVFKLARTTLKEYLDQYKGYMGNED